MESVVVFIFSIAIFVYSVVLHEIAHGYVALRLGDPTAKAEGRLTLNPVAHVDLIWTILMPLMFILADMSPLGGAKPVPVNMNLIRNTRMGLIWVSSAGIIANLLLAFLAVLLFRLISPSSSESLQRIFYYLIQINIILASFNLIPIPPLDGSKILMGFLPESAGNVLAHLEPYGFFVIIGLLYLGALDPVIHFFRWVITSLIGLLLF